MFRSPTYAVLDTVRDRITNDPSQYVLWGTSASRAGLPHVVISSTFWGPGLEMVAMRGYRARDDMPHFELARGELVLRLPDGSTETAAVIPWSKYHDRHGGLVATEPKRVVVVGAGSLGASLAIAFAKAGFAIDVIDPDVVEVANLARTPYRAADVGGNKVDAVAALCAAANPSAEVMIHPYDAMAVLAEEPSLFVGADLVVNCASAAVGFALADQLHGRVPMLFPGVHARGASGEIFVSSMSREAPCFSCFRAKIAPAPGTEPPPNYGFDGELHAEPALGADVAIVVAMAAAIGVHIVTGRPERAVPFDRRLLFVSMHANALFEEPFATRWVAVPRDESCPNHADRVPGPDAEAVLAELPEVAS